MPAITPTAYELKEGGHWNRARRNLMSGRPNENLPTRREAEAQQRGYLDDMAAGMGLKIVSKREHGKLSKLQEIQHRGHQALKRERKLKKERKQFRWQLRGLKDALKRMGPQRVTAKPKPIPHLRPKILPKSIYTPKKPKRRKKRQKLHTQRAGKTMKVLKKRVRDGQKVFAFPDSVWKVKKR